MFHSLIHLVFLLYSGYHICYSLNSSSIKIASFSRNSNHELTLFQRWKWLGMPFPTGDADGNRSSSRIRISQNVHNMVKERGSFKLETNPPNPSCNIIIREAVEGDLPMAARILTDGFFRDTTNFFTYPIERLNTFLSLNSSYQTFRFSERTGARFAILVACDLTTGGKVVGCCQVDDSLPKGEIDPSPRPYMCNLAVDDDFRRAGIARLLVLQCENIVRDEWEKPTLHLKMMEGNEAAFGLYFGIGYRLESRYVNAKNENVLLLAKSLD
mmetsp:Transcript_44748/g.52442  ORF Transcript_44748/g.52442 Transcript_44748/m.52442 type:complete len:270 (+) Transcript_44748:122-931(+)